ncbi:hypothetical protein [Nocardia sp. NPDC004123]
MTLPHWVTPPDETDDSEIDKKLAARLGVTVDQLHEIDRQMAEDVRARDAVPPADRIVDSSPKFNEGFGPDNAADIAQSGEIRASATLPPLVSADDAMAPNYDAWTRLPVFYFPITVGDTLIGYLWGSQDGKSAGFFRNLASAVDRVKFAVYWNNRLEETYGMGLTPAEAIEYWRGRPGDPQLGAIAGDAERGESRTIQELALRLNPDKPLGDGPWVQDGTFPSGSPEDRSEGFSAIAPSPTTTYPEETASAVIYLPVSLKGTIVGYVWASTSDDAAGYIPRTAVGHTGFVAGGLWRSRLINAHMAGLSALDAVRRCRSLPDNAPGTFGVIDPIPEQEAPTLADLRRLADQD